MTFEITRQGPTRAMIEVELVDCRLEIILGLPTLKELPEHIDKTLCLDDNEIRLGNRILRVGNRRIILVTPEGFHPEIDGGKKLPGIYFIHEQLFLQAGLRSIDAPYSADATKAYLGLPLQGWQYNWKDFKANLT